MGYTVLARKWRPKNFGELVGQQHVMQALANALDQNRLHHAYLFTGTRGVGKTTIARIFAKALNCEQGITSKPCGVCENCRAIDEGKFIDLIEVDAASKTKVDDTREILDNVQFAATQGRFKVYLIDEVHMLSKSSFNALLKTLEEPPEHVKFILATTDPHKLPITVLSRCLQFNLMRLTELQIQNHLANVLTQEAIPFEVPALSLIAKSADGSVRDALSLLDQAIAYGAGQIAFTPIQTMLGLVDQQFTYRVLQALATNDSAEVKTLIGELSAMGVDYQALLSQLIEALHGLSYFQLFQTAQLNASLPETMVAELAKVIAPERVQMLYQIALLTKQDMQLAPDIRIGFEMGLMRMLAFTPVAGHSESQISPTKAQSMNTQGLPAGKVSPNVVQNSVTAMQSQTEVLNDSALSVGLNPNEPSMIQDMPLNDAMSHLSSARSLVSKAKKKPLAADNSRLSETTDTISAQNLPEVQANTVYRPVDSAIPVQNLSEIPAESSMNMLAEQGRSSAPSQNSDFNHTVDHAARLQQSLQALSVDPILEKQEMPVLSLSPSRTDGYEQNFAVGFSEKSPPPLIEAGEDLQSRNSFSPQASMQPDGHESLEGFENPVMKPETQFDNQNMQTVASSNVSLEGDALKTWMDIIHVLNLEGMNLELANNCVLLPAGMNFSLSVIPEQDFPHIEPVKAELLTLVANYLRKTGSWLPWQGTDLLTPKQFLQNQAAQRLIDAKQSLQSDAKLAALTQALNLEVLTQTFKAADASESI